MKSNIFLLFFGQLIAFPNLLELWFPMGGRGFDNGPELCNFLKSGVRENEKICEVPLIFSYGVAKKLEFGFSFGPTMKIRNNTEVGINDLRFAMKYSPASDMIHEIAIRFPTGDYERGLGKGFWGASTFFAILSEMGKVSICGGVGYETDNVFLCKFGLSGFKRNKFSLTFEILVLLENQRPELYLSPALISTPDHHRIFTSFLFGLTPDSYKIGLLTGVCL